MDLRRHHRFPVQFQSMFSGSKFNESLGTMGNLSESSCGIQTDSQVYPGKQLTLQLHVPNGDAPIKIEQAAVHWNRVGEIGLGFITVSPAERQPLGNLIEQMN